MSQPISLVFVDTEFTSLGESGPSELISVGAVDFATGERFYLESADFDPQAMSAFTRDHVAPLLQRGELSVDFPVLTQRFFSFIDALPGPVMLAMDSAWDWAWMRAMAQGLSRMDQPLLDSPQEAPLWPERLRQDWLNCCWQGLSKERSRASRKERGQYFALHANHHALNDALGVMSMFKAALGPLFRDCEINERNLERFRKIFSETPAPPPSGPRGIAQ